MYSANAVANSIIQHANNAKIEVTPSQIQRLIFLCQLGCLRDHKYQLMDDTFVQWETGPVIPGIYHKLKAFGSEPVNRFIPTLSRDGEERNIPFVPQEDLLSHSVLLGQMARTLSTSSRHVDKDPVQLVHEAWIACLSTPAAANRKVGDPIAPEFLLELGRNL